VGWEVVAWGVTTPRLSSESNVIVIVTLYVFLMTAVCGVLYKKIDTQSTTIDTLETKIAILEKNEMELTEKTGRNSYMIQLHTSAITALQTEIFEVAEDKLTKTAKKPTFVENGFRCKDNAIEVDISVWPTAPGVSH